MVRPTREESRDTALEILDAALDLFSEHGFAGTSMRSIARAVGVRESTLYHHYASKEAILAALLHQLGGDGKAERLAGLDLETVIARGPREVTRQLARALVTEWATPRERKFARLMLSEGPRQQPGSPVDPAAMMERARRQLSLVFAALIERGLLGRFEPEAMALGFMGPLAALRIMYLVMSPAPVDLPALLAQVDRHVDFFFDATGAAPAVAAQARSR